MKKTLILISFILMTSAELYSETDINGQEKDKSLSEMIKPIQNDNSLMSSDTIVKHNVKEIDGHLVIQDTIIIQNLVKHDVETLVQDNSYKSIEKVMVILVFTFVICSLIYKRKKNG
jgi:hypothetical protein